GGTLERPALQRLLADIASGRIDIIVVYKVDRLTRSLMDFSKLVEAFDKAGTSFVSVTQSFNTTTSMGRLTLNMLLSFAQFEREVTAERIRDKIAASKAKGMWMGGTPPLGYKPEGRSLAIVEEHAAVIRDIFARYRDLGTVRQVEQALIRERIRTPARVNGKGRAFGNCSFTRGQLYSILKNPIYVGLIPHKGQVFAGQHPPIIERSLWDAVQTILNEHAHGKRQATNPDCSVLAGRIVDASGEPLIAVHASKAARGGGTAKVRYRYYVSKALHHGDSEQGHRIPALKIEGAVAEMVAAQFDDVLAVAEQAGLDLEPALLHETTQRAVGIAAGLRQRARAHLRELVQSVAIQSDGFAVALDAQVIADLLG
ncbi:MAG: recombinase family protein, partial [Sphingomonadales bacterium]